LRAIWRVPALSRRLADRADRRLPSAAEWDITGVQSRNVETAEDEATQGRETAAGTVRHSCSKEPLRRGASEPKGVQTFVDYAPQTVTGDSSQSNPFE
jgi:hypothetical protein